MSIRTMVKKSGFYAELEKDNRTDFMDYFDIKAKKFLHAIDTLYYSVSLLDDKHVFTECPYKIQRLISHLDSLKTKLLTDSSLSMLPIFNFDNLFMVKNSIRGYSYHLSCPDVFDFYIYSSIPNKHTPRVQVQLRSFSLWNDGYKSVFNRSFKVLTDLLKIFDICTNEVKEMRIDYAYHTNAITMNHILCSDKSKTIKTNLDVADRNFKFKKKSAESFENSINYMSFGSRASNNIFVRIYDKALEVVEIGKKSYFIEQWHMTGLISDYDKYCLEYAYLFCNYDYVYKAQLKFYIEYGSDPERVARYKKLFDKAYVSLQVFKQAAMEFMPPCTPVINVEFETKRKYYKSSDRFINLLNCSADCDPSCIRIFKILENRNIFIDSLTSDNFAFLSKKTGKYADWWNRLKSTQIEVLNFRGKLLREYSRKLDGDTIKRQILNSIATYSVYFLKKSAGNFVTDVEILLNSLFCNSEKKDEHFLKITFFQDLKEHDIKYFNPRVLNKYLKYKELKYKLVKNRL